MLCGKSIWGEACISGEWKPQSSFDLLQLGQTAFNQHSHSTLWAERVFPNELGREDGH
jgi:hypothetical protein